MLTATYALVALSLEHSQLRADVQAFQESMSARLHYPASGAHEQAAHACAEVKKLRTRSAARLAERLLFPMLSSLLDCKNLLSQMQAWEDSADAALSEAAELLRGGREPPEAALWASLEHVCSAMLARLALEQAHLLPLARQQLGEAAWFQLAHRMLEERALRPAEREEAPHWSLPLRMA